MRICVDGDVCIDIGLPSFRDWQNTPLLGAFVLQDSSIVQYSAWTSQRGHIRRLNSHKAVTVETWPTELLFLPQRFPGPPAIAPHNIRLTNGSLRSAMATRKLSGSTMSTTTPNLSRG